MGLPTHLQVPPYPAETEYRAKPRLRLWIGPVSGLPP
jgi:hypothetical protein